MKEITYRVLRSQRRTTAIEIGHDGTVLVRCPHRMPDAQIRELIRNKASWIQKKLAVQPVQENPMTEREMRNLANHARKYISARVEYYSNQIGVTYGRIAIRHQKTRWGSCSSKGNLNFNCLLMLAPEQVIDYVVVHELCHRIHMNHSDAFWARVKEIMPDYAHWRKWLKDNGRKLLSQLPDK